MAAPTVVATRGCFSYARLSGGRIRLHFRNAETDGLSPLGIERRGQRLADLAALFEHVKRTLPEPLQVVGASWLYNLDAYRRLFERQASLDSLDQCFPFQVLSTEASVQEFYGWLRL